MSSYNIKNYGEIGAVLSMVQGEPIKKSKQMHKDFYNSLKGTIVDSSTLSDFTKKLTKKTVVKNGTYILTESVLRTCPGYDEDTMHTCDAALLKVSKEGIEVKLIECVMHKELMENKDKFGAVSAFFDTVEQFLMISSTMWTKPLLGVTKHVVPFEGNNDGAKVNKNFGKQMSYEDFMKTFGKQNIAVSTATNVHQNQLALVQSFLTTSDGYDAFIETLTSMTKNVVQKQAKLRRPKQMHALAMTILEACENEKLED